MRGLGPDGHPAKGAFLPAVPLPRRMWAGGQLDLFDTIRVGDLVERRSRVEDVNLKDGRTGPLCFVTVRHEIITSRGTAIKERQDIVYRALEKTAATPPKPAATVRQAQTSRTIMADPVLLFRYSALTFNGHRIHYDRDYATREEGYPGLVVHGPLQATLLIALAEELRGTPKRFEFRGSSPLFDGAEFTINAAPGPNGLDLWVADRNGRQTMTATANW
jgi:3-methylfumaryl-CoA hydratase